jgi:sodium-coupled monocarboxylate transporter 8/12
VFYGSGLILFAFYQVHGDPLAAGHIQKTDQILPYFVVTELPAGVSGLLIAAIYAASMSTISAGINSLTSASLIDFYQRLWPRPDLSEHHQLNLARRLTLVYGVLVIAFAFLVQHLGTLLEASNSAIGLVGGPLLGMFFLGIFVHRATARGAFVGWFAGIGVLLSVWLATHVSFIWYTLIGCGSTMMVGYLVSLSEVAPERQRLEGLVWSRHQARVKDPT